MSNRPSEIRQTDARLVLAFVCATAFTVVLNGTMLPVALPEIGSALSLGSVALGWIITGYFLVNGVAIPFFGRLADIYGVARLYAIGLATFFLGSVLCTLAPGFATLMAGRLVQGAGAAAVVGLGPTAVSLVFPAEIRGRSLGLVGAAVGAGAAAGPVFGGAVTDLFGWRILFAAGVLFGALVPLASRMLPRGAGSPESRLDLAGGVLFAFALGGALLALTRGAEVGIRDGVFLASVGVAVVASVLFVFRQATAPEPFVPRALLANRAYVWLCAATLLLIGVIVAVEVAVPLPLAQINGLGATQIGLVLAPSALLTVVWGPVSGRLVDRLGVAAPTALGAAACIAGVVLLSGFGVGGAAWVTAALVVVVGVGITLGKIATSTGVSLTVPEENLPSGIAVNEMVWICGISVGTALFTAVAAARSGAPDPLNPFHSGPGVGYSDAFLVLSIPLVLLLLTTPKLRGAGKKRSR
ncbi:MFS transporter [Rubrobacter tropicus]|uniref:MFS transporter n=1 Tax=Rubrobacter tropicus TaxID=2653851 RepID=UPI001A9D2A32|nr:MFS transporter [Rubrobacter tropicus]